MDEPPTEAERIERARAYWAAKLAHAGAAHVYDLAERAQRYGSRYDDLSGEALDAGDTEEFHRLADMASEQFDDAEALLDIYVQKRRWEAVVYRDLLEDEPDD